ncbi:MAG TPA: FG-GAP-like repeat-containing protein [Flavobacteriales bacterium]|nr:FG-GAP-like repeat-containing protein [Flavobacteriales bacterium]
MGPSVPVVAVLLALSGCTGPGLGPSPTTTGDTSAVRSPLLVQHSGEAIGMPFRNAFVETDEINYYRFRYLYLTGGVATGDVDGDGLPEVFVVSSRDGVRLYRNRGGLHFEDVTTKAGIAQEDIWPMGTSMADIDGNGHLDLYVVCGGPTNDPERLRDRVYLNRGDGTFEERGRELGLNPDGHGIMAYFHDIDVDGDLDLFLLGHRMDFEASANVEVIVPAGSSLFSNRLFINDGNGRFTDNTVAAGLLSHTWSLGAAIGDVNGDDRPDIHVANDFVQPDMLYIQQPDGRFIDEVRSRLGHVSYYSMGVDRADMNNDGHPDLCVLDMTPPDHGRSKQNMASMRPEDFDRMTSIGWHAQYMANQLHLNNGDGSFSEIGHLAGVDRTDWSWAPLFVDLDNDGWKDLFVSNGVWRDITNNDLKRSVARIKEERKDRPIRYEDIAPLLPFSPMQNHVFRNQGDLTFSKAMAEWGYQHAGVSTAASVADLDADGDMDLVVVDVNGPMKVVENRSRQRDGSHYLQLALRGPKGNPFAVGTRALLYAGGTMQHAELVHARGFQSSVEPLIHFGLGDGGVDSVVLHWPDGTWSRIDGPKADQRIAVAYEALPHERRARSRPTTWFTDVSSRTVPGIGHTENSFDDFRAESLLPHRQSTHGPALVAGDVNGDGLDDLFLGAATGNPGQLLLQGSGTRFAPATTQPWSAHSDQEIIGACLFDADGDGDLDLYTAAGSTEWSAPSARYQDRLYVNDGRGRFTEAVDAMPPMPWPTQVVVADDVDGDGDMDLFVGGRNVPGAYPSAPRSVLLRNDGGRFSDVTAGWCAPLTSVGMVTGAALADLDADGRKDLVVTGEWMPVLAYRNTGTGFARAAWTDSTLTGWWQGITVADLDGDGDQDLVTGNIGLNNKFHPSKEKPLELYMADLDGTGTNDIVLAKHGADGTCFPVRGRECSSEQMPFLKQKFPTFKSFAEADVHKLYGPKLDEALHVSATEFRSLVWWNEGGRFSPEPLPNAAQAGPLRSVVVVDLNGDGHLDMVGGGNLYGTEVETSRYDGSTGVVLLGNGHRGFDPVPVAGSGFTARGDVRQVVRVRTGGGGQAFVVAVNNGPLRVFVPERVPAKGGLALR